MEFVIAAGIGLLGWKLARSSSANSDVATVGSSTDAGRYLGPELSDLSTDDPQPGARIAAADVRRAESRWRDALDPRSTGIVTPGTAPGAWLPFFSQRGRIDDGGQLKQTKMELFTGANSLGSSLTGTYRRRREVPRAFPARPPGAGGVTSSGTLGNAPYDHDAALRRATDTLTTTQNNVGPAPQTRVGPAVGYGPDVPAADGFHMMYRPMPTPESIGADRKNPLPGSVIPGAAHVGARTAEMPVRTNGLPRYATMAQRPPLPERAAVQAPQARPEHRRDAGRIVDDAGYFGIVGSGVVTGAVRTTAGDATRDSFPGGLSTPFDLNPTGARAGVGGYTNATVRSQKPGSAGKRDVAAVFAGADAGTSAVRGPSQAQAYDVRPTMRGAPMTYVPVGGAGAGRSGGPEDALAGGVAGDVPRPTLRDAVSSASFGAWAASSVLGPSVVDIAPARGDAKRADQLVSYTPGPERAGVFAGAKTAGAVRVRDDASPQALASFGYDTRGGVWSPGVLGAVRQDINKLDPVNPRLGDLNIAREVLAGNDLALPSFTDVANGTVVRK